MIQTTVLFFSTRPPRSKLIDSKDVSFRDGRRELLTGATKRPDLRFVVSTFVYSDGGPLLKRWLNDESAKG